MAQHGYRSAGNSYDEDAPPKFEEWTSNGYQDLLLQQQQQEEDEADGASTSAAAGASHVHDLSRFTSQQQQQPKLSDNELKSAIAGHPQYRELVRAHLNCHKIGASQDSIAEIEELFQKFEKPVVKSSFGANPELDQFMVAYRDVLNVCEEELRSTYMDAIQCCRTFEEQLMEMASIEALNPEAESYDDNYLDDLLDELEAPVPGLAEDHQLVDVDPSAGDKELKRMLMLKYKGFIKGLTNEYLKKKKKGKLPPPSRQMLLDWWSQHQEHPYPTDDQKTELAKKAGLDLKQVNNWFINQRKRHWHPSAGRSEEAAGKI